MEKHSLQLVAPDSPSEIRLTTTSLAFLENCNGPGPVHIKEELPNANPSLVRNNEGNVVDSAGAREDGSVSNYLKIESELHTCNSKLIRLEKQIEALFAGISVISDYISDKFDVEIIDKSVLFRNCVLHSEEIHELAKSMSILQRNYISLPKPNPLGLRRSSRQINAKWKVIKGKGQPSKKVTWQAKKSSFRDRQKEVNGEMTDSDSKEYVLPHNAGSGSETDESTHEINEEDTFTPTSSSSKNKMSFKAKDTAKNSKPVDYDVFSEDEAMDLEDEDDDNVEKIQESEPELSPKEMKRLKKRLRRKELRKRTRSTDGSESEGPRKRGRPKKKPEEKIIHIDKIPMQCEECGKILKGSGSLKSHMNMHADLRPYPCPEEGCGKRFRVKNKLSLHMLIHKGEKTEQCRFCGRMFFFLKDLERHERTHTGEKPYPCPQPNCNKSFNVKQHLTLHLRVHTGEKPYHCVICNKSFSQANSLRIHKKIHERTKLGTGTDSQVKTITPRKSRKVKNKYNKPKRQMETENKNIPQPEPIPDFPVQKVDVDPHPRPVQSQNQNQLPISIVEPTNRAGGPRPIQQYQHQSINPNPNELVTLVLQTPGSTGLPPETKILTSSCNNQLQFITITPSTSTSLIPQQQQQPLSLSSIVQETWKLQNPQPTSVLLPTSLTLTPQSLKIPLYGIQVSNNHNQGRLPITVISTSTQNRRGEGQGEGNYMPMPLLSQGIQEPSYTPGTIEAIDRNSSF